MFVSSGSVMYKLESGRVAGKIISLHSDENHDLIVLATSQGSIILMTLRTLPFSKDLPDRPPSPRGFLPVDELSLVDILLVDNEEREEAQKNSEVLCFYIEGNVGFKRNFLKREKFV